MLIKPVSRREKGILLEHLFHPARHSGYPMLALTNLHGPEIRGSKGFEDSSACLRRSLLRPIFLATKLVGFLPNQLRFVEEAAMTALEAKVSISKGCLWGYCRECRISPCIASHITQNSRSSEASVRVLSAPRHRHPT